MKRELQGLATREKLLDSAERLFFERGVVSTTLEDIARASDMTRGAIYGHFTNKWSLVSALFERSQLPLDPFTVSGVEASASIDALRVELERRLADVLRIGTKRRLYAIALSTAGIHGDCTLSASMLRESVLLAQYTIEAALARVAKPPGASEDFDYAFEATFIHACLTGYFSRSLIIPPAAGTENMLAVKMVRKALSSWPIESPSLFSDLGGLATEAGTRR